MMKPVFRPLGLRAGSLVLVAGLGLTGCEGPAAQQTVTLSLSGKSTSTQNTVTGTATGAPFRDGAFNLKVSDGRVCDGVYQHKSRTEGHGFMTCQNGAVGTFEFVSDGKSGGGKAVLEDETFVFKFSLT